VLHVMQQLAEEGMTMVVVTHEMQFAREVANRVFLDKGCVAEEGIARQVITNPTSDRLRAFLSRMNVVSPWGGQDAHLRTPGLDKFRIAPDTPPLLLRLSFCLLHEGCTGTFFK